MEKAFTLVILAGFLGYAILQGAADNEDSEQAQPTQTRAAVPRSTATTAPTPDIQGRAAILRKKDDGHFWAAADVEGMRVDFLVDTGASSVVLTDRDARRIGLRTDDLVYNGIARTANGEVRTAQTRIERLQVGRVTAHDVPAIVTEGELHVSLLGMSFLGALRSFEFKGDNLILRE